MRLRLPLTKSRQTFMIDGCLWLLDMKNCVLLYGFTYSQVSLQCVPLCVCVCVCVCFTVFARGCTVGKAIMGLHLHICSVPIPAVPQSLFEEVFHI